MNMPNQHWNNGQQMNQQGMTPNGQQFVQGRPQQPYHLQQHVPQPMPQAIPQGQYPQQHMMPPVPMPQMPSPMQQPQSINPLLQNAISKQVVEGDPTQQQAVLDAPQQTIFEQTKGNYLNRLKEADQYMWNKDPEKAIKTRHPLFNNALEGGFEQGLYILGAPPNTGKTAILMDLLNDIVSLNDELFIAMVSLDDAMHKIVSRFVAVNQKMMIKEVKNPKKYLDEPGVMEKRAKGMQFLEANSEKFQFFDSRDGSYIEDWQEKIEGWRMTLPKGTRIMIVFDSFSDLRSRDYKGDKEEEYIARTVKEWTNEYDCIVLGTAHMRKSNGKKRPVRDDLRGANTLEYEADLIWLLYNEVKAEKEGANIYWTEPDNPYKQPVLELNFSKNKITDYDGVLFYHFSPSRNFIQEANEDRQASYMTSVYDG